MKRNAIMNAFSSLLAAACLLCSTAAQACNAHHVPAPTQKGNGSGLNFETNAPTHMAVGETVRISLSFSPARVDGAIARVRAPQGLTITRADGNSLGDIALTRGEATTVDLQVSSSIDGLQYFDVTTVQGGRQTVRSVALKVGSGQTLMKSSGNVQVQANGERLQVMQGETTRQTDESASHIKK